jgi:hypothetical protein
MAWVGVLLFVLPLVAHAYAGTASRYVSDDYCAGYIFKDYGYLGGQQWFYMNWGAVPATLLLMALTDPAGSHLTPILTAVALIAWVAALTWAARRITDACGGRWALPVSLLTAEVIVYATLQDSPNVVQSLYLRIPMFEYVLPLVALALYAGWIARLRSRDVDASSGGAGRIIVSGLATFVAGSLGPTYVVLQTAMLGVGVVVNRIAARLKGSPLDEARGTMERLLAAGLVGSLVAMALVAFAPGNALRQQHFPPPPGLVKLITLSFLSTVFMFVRPVLPMLRGGIAAIAPHVFASDPAWLTKALAMSSSPLTVVVLVAVGGLMGFTRSVVGADLGRPDRGGASSAPTVAGRGARSARAILLGVPAVAFVLVAACMAPSVYGTSAPPPPRALIEPQYVLVCALLGWSYAAGVWFRERGHAIPRWTAPAIALVVCAVGVIPIAASRQIAKRGSEYRAWAAEWDNVDGQLRAAAARGDTHVRVRALDQIGGVPAIVEDPKDWVNNCAARYYGLETITGVAPR